METNAQTLTALTNTAANLNTSMTNLQAAVVNPPNIATLTQTVGQFDQQSIPLYTPARPHKWAKDAKSIIMGWSDDHYNTTMNNPIIDETQDPPTLLWADTDDRLFNISKDVSSSQALSGHASPQAGQD